MFYLAKSKNIEQRDITLECNVCGEKSDFKCIDCGQETFCSECDEKYHRHPLRTKHMRTALKQTSKYSSKYVKNNNVKTIMPSIVTNLAPHNEIANEVVDPSINKVEIDFSM